MVWYGMVWYGMVVYQKDGKTCEGSPLSALQAYNQIISLLCPFCFPIISLVVPYYFLIFSLCVSFFVLLLTYYFPLTSLCLPYYFPIISLFYTIIVPYASQLSKTIILDTWNDSVSTVMLSVWNLQKYTHTQIDLQHFCSLEKVVPTVSTKYNREQLGKYTGKLITTDPGIRVWYGMVVYQKDCKNLQGGAP